MGTVSVDLSMSLDGFVAGPDDGPEAPLGRGGERLHEWVYGLASWRARHGHEGGQVNRDAEILEEAFATTGAIVMGRRMFDLAEVPWGDNPPFHVPVFVVTHRGRAPIVKQGGTTFTFVTDGVEGALDRARAAAGDADISIAGGASIAQQALRAGLLDQIQVHVVPILLGGGRRLFDDLGTARVNLETDRVVPSPAVTHMRFRVMK